ncbi:SBBP repeat-containing protein, partial [Pontibacter toksunensis]
MKATLSYPVLQLLLYLLCMPAVAQQPTLEWAQRYNGLANTEDNAVSVFADEAGNSYVTGTSTGILPKMTTVKYSPSGERLWVVQFENNTVAIATALDNSGALYVTGISHDEYNNTDYTTIRYDAATGRQVWVQRYDGLAGFSDRPTAIAVDNQGGVYVTGHSYDESFVLGYATVRYDAVTGEETWTQRYNGNGPSSYYNQANAIAADNAGGIYVTGYSIGSDDGSSDYATVRYDAATGEETWVSRYGTGNFSEDQASAITVDMAGGVYVTGFSMGNGFSPDYATVRYDAASGGESWVSRYEGPNDSNDQATAIAADANGVYVTGSSSDGSSGSAYLTVRYHAATGEEAWSQAYEELNASNSARAIAVDGMGGVYVTGSSVNGVAAYATVRYDAATGELTWVSRYEGPNDSNDQATAIAADANGVYVTGFSGGDFATILYSAGSGAETWVQRFDQIGSTHDVALSVAVDEAGNSYVTGTSQGTILQITTVKYSASGEQLWAVQFESHSFAAAIAVDKSGGVYVTGSTYGGEFFSLDYVTVRYDAETGEQTWASLFGLPNSDDIVRAIAVDAGGVYVTGSSVTESFNTDYGTVRYDAVTGEQTWAQHFNGPASGEDQATAIAVDASGGVYVTGYSYVSDFNVDYGTVRYDAATGVQTWAQLYNGPTGGDDRATAIAADNQGGVYVAGSSNGSDGSYDYGTVRYDAASGVQTWASHYNAEDLSYEEAAAIAVDNGGGVYVTGSSYGDLSADYGTVRYDAATGEQTWAQLYNGPAGSDDRATAIAVDDQGSIFVTGRSYDESNGADYATLRYAAATGGQVWVERYNSSGSNADVAMDMALDSGGNPIVTGYSDGGADTGNDFLTLKYSQQDQCPDIAQAPVTGNAAAKIGTTGLVYTLANTGASSFHWSITDSGGNTFTGFSGQGTSSITVNWPSVPDFFKVSVSFGGPGGGCVVSTAVTYVHVYAPDAGFVTGSGWIESPAAPAYEFMQTSRRAHWSQVASYSKRNGEESQVQGATMLLLQAGSFTFRSTSYEPGSLVITGNRAYYSGRGTL